MGYKGRLTAANLKEVLAGAGIDTGENGRSISRHNEAAIKDTLARNNAQAKPLASMPRRPLLSAHSASPAR